LLHHRYDGHRMLRSTQGKSYHVKHRTFAFQPFDSYVRQGGYVVIRVCLFVSRIAEYSTELAEVSALLSAILAHY